MLVRKIKKGYIGVIPTDTIYGLVGFALLPETVERIYKVRKRSPDKPFIILISSIEDLKIFNIELNKNVLDILIKVWPGKITVILPCLENKFEYLHRGTNKLALRFPDKPDLIELIKNTGPIVAPSVNFEGEFPAKNIEEAKKYFSKDVDFYVDEGDLISEPSTIIEIKDGEIVLIRKGAVKI